ncbi:MAG: hypothetical protein H8D45_00090 [Bacteroidetes bacterium]|nr:hypothetical protein [Bacteroidota bacterium]
MDNNNENILLEKNLLPFFQTMDISMFVLNILTIIYYSIESQIPDKIIQTTPTFWFLGLFFLLMQKDKIVIYKKGIRLPKKRFSLFHSDKEIEIINFEDLKKVRVSN